MKTKINTTQSFKNLRGRLLIGIAVVCMLAVSGLRADEAQGGAPAMGGLLQQTNVDSRLWALWYVEAIDVKLPGQNTRRFDLQTLLAQPAFQSLSSTMFISLYFFDNNVGVNIQNPPPNVSLKGTFATSGNQLTITMQDNRRHTFAYRFDAEKLVVTQTISGAEISVIFNVEHRD